MIFSRASQYLNKNCFWQNPVVAHMILSLFEFSLVAVLVFVITFVLCSVVSIDKKRIAIL